VAGEETLGMGEDKRRARARHERTRRARSSRLRLLIGGAVVLLVLLAGGVFAFAHASAGGAARPVAALAPGATIDGVGCQGNESIVYHIHAHLSIYHNGAPVVLPGNVGIPVNPAIPTPQHYCFYWLHTHGPYGFIHVESPTQRLYTLGQFFDIWRQTALADAQGKLGYNVDASFPSTLKSASPSAVRVYVDGRSMGSSYKNITLTDHKLITLEVGSPLKAPMTRFDWNTWNGI